MQTPLVKTFKGTQYLENTFILGFYFFFFIFTSSNPSKHSLPVIFQSKRLETDKFIMVRNIIYLIRLNNKACMCICNFVSIIV